MFSRNIAFAPNSVISVEVVDAGDYEFDEDSDYRFQIILVNGTTRTSSSEDFKKFNGDPEKYLKHLNK